LSEAADEEAVEDEDEEVGEVVVADDAMDGCAEASTGGGMSVLVATDEPDTNSTGPTPLARS
jgi:hypothetical protein